MIHLIIESKVSEKAENARLGKTYEIATENLDTTTKECNMKIENFKRSEIDELRFERECDQAEKLKREEEKYIRDLNETMYQKQNELKQRFSKRIQQQNELISRMYEIIVSLFPPYIRKPKIKQNITISSQENLF